MTRFLVNNTFIFVYICLNKDFVIQLKPLSDEHVTPFYTWLNDNEVIRYSLSVFQTVSSNSEIDHWFKSLLNDKKNYTIGIFLHDTDELIGYTGICNISRINKSGEFFIFIGEKKWWGKGIGTMTTQKIIDYGFNSMYLNRINLTVSEPNISGVQAYLKAGFQLEGRQRQACFRDGTYHDKLIMSILRDEFILN